jgi:hypothetical protein
VEGLAISDPRGFAQGTMLSARRVRLGISAWALLSRTLRLESVRVESARLRLWQDARGVGNWEGLGGSAAGPGAPGARLVLEHLHLHDAALASWGPDGRPQLGLSGIEAGLDARGEKWDWNFKVGRIRTFGARPASLEGPDIEGSVWPGRAGAPTAFRLVGEGKNIVFEAEGRATAHTLELTKGRVLPWDAPLAIQNLTARVSFDSTSARLERLAGQVGRSPFEVSAVLKPAPVRGLVRAHLDLADLARLLPPELSGPVSGRVQLAARFQGPSLDPDSLSYEGTADLFSVAWQPRDKNSPPLTDLSGRVWLRGQAASLSGLTGRYGPVPFRAGASIRRPFALASAMDPKRKSSDPVAEVHFDLATGAIDAAKLFPPGKPLAAPPALVAEGVVRAERLVAGRLDASEVVADVRYDRGLVELRGATARVYGGTTTASGRFDCRDLARPTYDVQVQAAALEAASLLTAWTPFPRLLSGKLDVNLGLGGASFLPKDALASLTAVGLARAVGGRVAGSRVLEEAARWTGLSDVKSIDFRDLLWRFRIDKGRMTLTDSWIHTASGDYSIGGSVGLDGGLALAVSAVLPQARLAALPAQVRTAAGFFQDEAGRVLLDFGIGGTVKSPRFAWRTDRAAARFAARLQSELAGRAAPVQRAFEDSLARSRAAIESRLRAQADQGRKQLDEAVGREQKRLGEKARSWLGGFLGGGARPDTSAGAPLALPPADTSAAHDSAGAKSP